MKVGPAGDANSVLEFVMDNVNHQELDDRAGEPSTGNYSFKFCTTINDEIYIYFSSIVNKKLAPAISPRL